MNVGELFPIMHLTTLMPEICWVPVYHDVEQAVNRTILQNVYMAIEAQEVWR